MRSLFGSRLLSFVVLASLGLLAAEAARNRLGPAQRAAGHSMEDAADETTGSVGAVLPLSDEQRERIYRGVMQYPDAARADARADALPEALWSDKLLQDLPASVTGEIPLLRAHKFVKLDDRILLVDPASRAVVAMIPRYRLLP
jgi:hypothetical protein